MQRLFISYARKDGAELAARLQGDLSANGYAPWLDLPQIAGGDDWAMAIEQAIDGCDGLLALLTHGAYASRICRAEQARALRKHKLVIPLLVQADADRPIYLEGTHYIAFAPPREYAEAWKELLDDLRAERGIRWDTLPEPTRALVVEEERTGVTDPLASWANLQAASARHTGKLLADLAGSEQKPGTFDPALYVARAAVEQVLDRLLRGSEQAAALIGDPGVGKTNTLCRWAGDRLAAGDAVFAYTGATLLAADVGQRLAEDLSLDEPPAVRQALAGVETLASGAGRKVVVIVDAINDHTGGQRDPADLLRHVNDLVGRLPGANVKVVLSCSASTWNRLDRNDATRDLHWSLFVRPEGDNRAWTLGAFTEAELEAAYAKYHERFKLPTAFAELAPRVRDVVRQPLMLRLLAEAYAGSADPITEGSLDQGVYRRYWAQRIREPRDQYFVEQFARQLFEQNRTSLPLGELARDPAIGADVLNEGPGSSFQRLLETGVIALTRGDLFTVDKVGFTHATIGAYALARHLLTGREPAGAVIDNLVAKAGVFPLAWDAAQALLLMSDDPGPLTGLAGSQDAEKRELAAETLCKLHAIKAEQAQELLRTLMDGTSEEARRTALRAAYGIGPATRNLFLRAAMRGSPELRQAAKDILYLIWRHAASTAPREVVDTLYVIWRHDADFTYNVLRDLLGRIRVRDLASLKNTLEFILDLSITIYINHCERRDVIDRTAELYYDLAVNRLHLPRIQLGDALETVVLRALATAFSGRILNWMLFSQAGNADRMLVQAREVRGPLLRVARALDPAEDLAAVQQDIQVLLERDDPSLSGAAALALAVHSVSRFPSVVSVHRDLFATLPPRARLWQLLSFAVLLPDTPVEWKPLLEDFTRALLDETPDALDQHPAADLVAVPLGLAYGKAREPMRLYDDWIRDGLERDDQALIGPVLAGLGPVGFYYPEAVLRTLAPFVVALAREPWRPALARTLAIVRALHFDAVDDFLSRANVDEAFRRQVAAAADVSVVHRPITLLGFYNNAVHFSIAYPRMRRTFSAGALTLMTEAATPNDFIVDYAKGALRLFRESGFRLIEWTRPDDEAAQGS